MRDVLPLVLLSLLLTCAACGDDDDSGGAARSEPFRQSAGEGNVNTARDLRTPEQPDPAARPGQPTAGGLTWEAPEPFQAQRPSSSMRAAEYIFPEEEEGESPASMSVFFFGRGQGGSVQDNVDRWVRQFRQPDGSDSRQAAEITHREVNGLQVTLVRVAGIFTGGMGAGGPAPEQPDQRMLGAIAEGPEGPVFFKLTGDSAVVERAEHPFEELVESFRPL